MALAIPKDSLVLVTGCTGFIASHTVDQLLQAGYKVRGTTRNASKLQGLKTLWEKKYGEDKFEIAIVQEMGEEGAFDEAVKGVAGVAHVASNLSWSPDPNVVIPDTIEGIKSILASAAKEASIKRFVYTSSSTACTEPYSGKKFHIDSNMWNDKNVEEAWLPPPYESSRSPIVYAASKTQGERAFWEFVKDKKPHFVANAVLPNCNFGTLLDTKIRASTGDWPRALYNGEKQGLEPQWFVDVDDTARLHVAALIYSDVKDERIFGFAEPFNWNDILRILRKLRPNQKIMDDYLDDEKDRDLSTVANERAIELLKRMGRPGFTSLEESIKNAIADLE